ncbi:MAG: hypothetical protein M1832_000836 [Thelocarpon impressellum]|nr:MAG: hypothetical protein M1832_000836 [Thelocarpon impressellum]
MAGERSLEERDVIEDVVTPVKNKKKVRFSDFNSGVSPSGSTGLTPAVRRHTLTPVLPSAAKKLPSSPSRRRSLPAKLLSETASTGTLQFAPLRQVLDGRVQRRLKRNHLSEETNAIEAEKREGAKRRKREVDVLREEIADKDQRLGELKEQLEAATQIAHESGMVDVHGDDMDKVSGLEGEVVRLKSEMSRHESALGLGRVETVDDVLRSTVDCDGFSLLSHDFDANETDIRESSPYRQSDNARPAEKGSQSVALEEQIQALKASLRDMTAEHEHTITTQQRILSKLAPFVPATASQSSDDASGLDAALDSVITALVLAQSHSEDARAAVSALTNEIAILGFPGEHADDMLESIQAQFRRARLELEYVQPGENVEGFENSKLLAMLVERARKLMQRVQQGEKSIEDLRRKEKDAQEQLKSAQSKEYAAERRAIVAEKHWTATTAREKAAEERVKELEVEMDEKERSVAMLQRALEGYRKEVKGLERLATRLEDEHNAATKRLRRESDEAVADLEGKLGAEAETIRDMEATAAERAELIHTLEARVSHATSCTEAVREQLQAIISSRESLISQLRSELANATRTHQVVVSTKDDQISSLETHLLDLSGSLASANASLNAVTSSKAALQARLEAETVAATRAMEAMQAELMSSLARVADVGDGFLNRGSEEGSFGLGAMPATPPTSKGQRRKRRWDSGIGVAEDDDEEDTDGGEVQAIAA